MRVLSNLFFKVTLSSMILTAPAMISGRAKRDGDSLKGKEVVLPFYSSAVIARFIDHPSLTAVPKFIAQEYVAGAGAEASAGKRPAELSTAGHAEERPIGEAAVERSTAEAAVERSTVEAAVERSTVEAAVERSSAKAAAGTSTAKPAEKSFAAVTSAKTAIVEKEASANGIVSSAAAKAAELRMVINQAVMLYSNMNLEKQGLAEKAFEYAWRGYYNLLKKGLIHKRTVLSICDFSQSCCSKRMYVIDVLHRRLLFRTYVAHGQNSGEEYATSFSNEPESFKSSLGFYVTEKVYYGRNGLSLRLNGVDSGYNDQALKRKIVLHGSSYVGDKYMQNFGTLGNSLGCPALPSAISGRIIRTVRDGSCLFIYHPTPQYLENSTIINS